MTSLRALAQEQIARLHRECIDAPERVREILREARAGNARLHAGVSRTAAARWCDIVKIGAERMRLASRAFTPVASRHYYFTLLLGAEEYFFGSRLHRIEEGGFLEFDLPTAIYRVERREAQRVAPTRLGLAPEALLLLEGAPRAAVVDVSRGGLGQRLPHERAGALPESVRRELGGGAGARSRLYAEIRNIREEGGSAARLGLLTSQVPSRPDALRERREPLHEGDGGWKKFAVASQVAATAVDRAWRRLRPERVRRTSHVAEVVRFENQLGQEIVGLVHGAGDPRGAPAVVIPPAWGKTKETLLPLALAMTETCAQQGLPITVLRYDGTHRRGESHLDPECRTPGEEYKRFRFSQAVRDLRCAMRFVREDPRFQAPRVVVVSFSLSAVEARRAVAEAPDEVAGWIPVVGMVDLQSGLRAVSGGVDYAEGILKGVHFGRHELVGVLADMDFTGRDALEAGLVFKEDARRDMARIHAPVTWVHGEHDAWMEVDRVRELLAAGSATNRRLVQVPTGHQLRTSREALCTFELVASEAVRMLWGRQVAGRTPALRAIDRARAFEAGRRRQAGVPVRMREFWADYLLGRQRLVGMDLLTSTSTYRELMQMQVAGLRLDASSRVLDLGSGTGGLLRELGEGDLRPARVLALDLVRDALHRSRGRFGGALPATFVQADFDPGGRLPCASASMDAALASLLVSYVRDPLALLRDLRRVVRPGGRVVVSSLRRDADISSIYAEGVAELVAAGAEQALVAEGVSFAELQRSFLNEAARLVDLEEQGLFRFYDRVELASLMRRAGFRVVSVEEGLGRPPQALVVIAERGF